jgi:hypothetical protein
MTSDTTTIRIIRRGVRRESIDGDMIEPGETGDVPRGVAETLEARGDCEIVDDTPDIGPVEETDSSE